MRATKQSAWRVFQICGDDPASYCAEAREAVGAQIFIGGRVVRVKGVQLTPLAPSGDDEVDISTGGGGLDKLNGPGVRVVTSSTNLHRLLRELQRVDGIQKFAVVGGGPPVVGAGVPTPTLSALHDQVDDVAFTDVVAVGVTGQYDCTGILVAPRFVLTAAHCADANEIAIGSRLEAIQLTVPVAGVVRHPSASVDIALLQLANAIPLGTRPRRAASDTGPPVGSVRLLGFGMDNFRNQTGFGIKRFVDVLSQGWGCDGARPSRTGCLAGVEMLLPPDSSRDTCYGDSGGPVLERLHDSWRLVAITSRSLARDGRSCGSGGIYVRVDAIAGWIDDVLRESR